MSTTHSRMPERDEKFTYNLHLKSPVLGILSVLSSKHEEKEVHGVHMRWIATARTAETHVTRAVNTVLVCTNNRVRTAR